MRDEEFRRLKSRHIKDKHTIGALRMKVEAQALELQRALDVPELQAEAYLDLLERAPDDTAGVKERGAAFDDGATATDVDGAARRSRNDEGYRTYDPAGVDAGDGSADEDDEDRSMRYLVRKQDARAAAVGDAEVDPQKILDPEWIQEMALQSERRKKQFQKKRKEQCVLGALALACRHTVSADTFCIC